MTPTFRSVVLLQAFYFDRDDVAFENAAKFFKRSAEEEKEHAEKLMKYQNQRGGRIIFKDIKRPEKDEWGTLSDAFESALALEKAVNESLLCLHKVAEKHGDAHMCDFLESSFLCEQVEAIKQLSGFITSLMRVGTGLGEYVFDKQHLGSQPSSEP